MEKMLAKMELKLILVLCYLHINCVYDAYWKSRQGQQLILLYAVNN